MAPRCAPSPGRRRPPISPAPSPACPARLRRGALRWGRRMRGPAGRLLLICPCFPLSGGPQDDGVPQFSLCLAGPGRGWAAPGPIPGQGSERLQSRELLLPGLLLVWLPNVTSSGSRRALPPPPPLVPPRLFPQGEWALSRGAQPPVWAKSCTALCPRPRPWLVGGRRGPGRRAERCAGLGTRPGDGGDAGSPPRVDG